MKILVYGVGALGSLMTHYLCKAGNDVTVAARITYENLKKDGLVVRHYIQRQTTVDHPRVVTEAPAEHFDIVLSVMQGQQQVRLLPILSTLDTDLLVLVGNNMETEKCEEALRHQNHLYGFQMSAGHRENGIAISAHMPTTELVIGGLHFPASSADLSKVRAAFNVSGYKVTPLDSMYGFFLYHIAEIMPYCYLCYRLGCDLKKAGRSGISQVMEASKECFDYLQSLGIPVMPPNENEYYDSGSKRTAMFALYQIMAKTFLGQLMVSDHCKNGLIEMEYLERKFEEFRDANGRGIMPVWDKMRNAMPSWEELRQIYGGRESSAITKPNYSNWMPKEMVGGAALGTGALLGAAIISSKKTGNSKLTKVLAVGTVGAGVVTFWFESLRRSFSYDGKRQLSKQIIEGTSAFIELPDGGVGLDIGCGSGALTIACAKRNPNAQMVGIDHWGPEYHDFSQQLCESNAAAEGVTNVSFQKGDANHLDFPDESFDAVTSNYVYHNIVLVDKQELLLETLRVLKKGGTFAIHDLMEKARYGDMEAFAEKLRAMGYEDVRLIDTTNGMFMSRKESIVLGLAGSTLLVGRK